MELEKELLNKFNWIVWDLDYTIQENGALGATKVLINVLWEQYYMQKPAFPKQEILAWIGELENLLSKYGEED
jgi:hypothetical protein